jgi:hypothetical protein
MSILQPLIEDDTAAVVDPYISHRNSAYSKFLTSANQLNLVNNDRDTNILYHYTTLNGFKSIVENGFIWGSNFSYLNDSTEMKYGKDMIKEIVNEKGFFQTGRYSEEAKSIVSGFLESLTYPASHAYGACFSSHEDILGQWRGYGQGVAIGFDRFKLQNFGISGSFLTKVNYDPAKARTTLSLLLEAFLNETLDHAGNENYPLIKEALKYSFQAHLDREVVSIKHKAFSDEGEWRLSYFRFAFLPPNDSPEIKFRNRDDMMIPYVELRPEHGGLLPIVSVRIGPVEKMKENLQFSVATLLVKHGYGDATLSISEVPFRT